MIKAEVSRNAIHVEASGTVMDISEEICVVIRSIYNTIQGNAEKALFRDIMQVCMEDDAPTWSTNIPGGTAVCVSVPNKGGRDDD